MGVIAKQDLSFSIGTVKQSRNRRSLIPGELVEAINVRQILEEGWRKRFGYDRTVPTAATGSITTPWDSFTFDGQRRVAMDADGEAWSLNGSSWETRGTAKRAMPTISSAATGRPFPEHPVAITVGTDTWIFTTHHLNGSTSGGFSWAIFDSDGNIIKPAAFVTVSTIFSLAAETDGTYVWLLITTTGANTVTSYKYTIASPSTAPTTATYWAGATSSAMVDAHRLASGSIAVAVAYRVGDNATLRVSYLNTSTGAESAVITPVATDIDAGAADINPSISPPSILTSDGSNGSWYVTMWGPASSIGGFSSATDNNLFLFSVTASSLLTIGIGLIPVSNTNPTMGWACGYLAGNGDIVVYATLDTYTGTPSQPRPYELKRYTFNGSVVATTSIRWYSYPVSKPQKVGSSWYLLTGYDDGPAADFGKSYFLIDSDGNILTQIGYAQAAAAGLTYDPSVSLTQGRSFTTPLRVSGNKLQCGLLVAESTQPDGAGFAISMVSCDLAASYGPPQRLRDGLAAWPAGIPVVAGTADNQHEIALMLSPANISAFSAGAGAALAGAQVVQYLYRITDADGTIYRSAPCPAESTTFNSTGQTVTALSLTHLMPGVTCQIEVYISSVNETQPYLNGIANNVPTGPTTGIGVTPAAIDTSAETIYTFGGGIENAPVPPSRTVGLWRNRAMLAHKSELWPSLERETGLGHRFNENFVTLWDDGEGDIIAHAPVDWNYYAVFKRNAIGVASGPGPFVTAGGGVAGNYEIQTLRIHHCDPVLRSLITGPLGCYFQSNVDGRVYAVTGQDVVDISAGMESYTSERVTATNYVAGARQVHFHMDSGAVMVLDTAHPTADQPYGRWMRWYSTGLLAAAGAAVDSTGSPVHLEAAGGAIRTQGTGYTDATSGAAAAVLMDVTTGDLGAAGGIRSGYRLDAVWIDGEWLAENTIKITVTGDHGATATEHTSAAIAAAPEEGYCRPRGHSRVRSTRVRIQETVSAGAGFIFQGITLTIQPTGRAKFPSNARRIA